jgi:hypothetical protein
MKEYAKQKAGLRPVVAFKNMAICVLMAILLLFGTPVVQGLSQNDAKDSPKTTGAFGVQEAFAATWYGYGWQQSGSGWWYADGYSYYTGWHQISGYWYYFDSAGWMYTGWLASNGHWYYLYKLSDFGSAWEGKMAKYGWEQIGGKWFYFRIAVDDIAIGDVGAILESGYWYVKDGSSYYWTWFNDNGDYSKRNLTKGVLSSTAERNSLASNYQWYSQGTYWANCLSFALDKVPYYNDDRDWTWPTPGRNPTITECQTWLKSHTQYKSFTTASPPVSSNYIIAYGKNGYVTHFARVNTSGAIYAKWGYGEIYKHTTTNPYKLTGAYGSRLFYAY